MDADTVLGAMHLVTDDRPPTTTTGAKLPRWSERGGTTEEQLDQLWEGFYLLATYCYDLYRAIEYIAEITADSADDTALTDPEVRRLAAEIVGDNEDIDALGSWKEKAELMEAIVGRIHGRVHDGHQEKIQRAAGGG